LLTSRNRVGMSIAELLVASGLLAVVLVTVMVLFGQLIKNTNKNALVSAGTFMADAILEQHVASASRELDTQGNNATDAFELVSGFTGASPDYSLDGGVAYSNRDAASFDSKRSTKFVYRIEAEHLDGFTSGGPGQLWRVKVEVRWWQDSTSGASQARAGSGKQSVERERIVYLAANR